MLSDIPRRLGLTSLAAILRNIKGGEFRTGSVVPSIAPGRFSFPPTEIKLLVALVMGAVLLFALGVIATSTILYSKQNFDVINATAMFVSEVQRVRGVVDDLELVEQRYLLSGEDRHLKRTQTIREQLNSSLKLLEQRPYGGSLQVGPLPYLKIGPLAERAALMEGVRSSRDLWTNPTLAVAQIYSDRQTLAFLRERLTGIYDTEKLALDQHLDRQGKRHRALMTISETIAVATAVLFLFVCLLIWSKLAANRRSWSVTPDLRLDTAAQSLASSSFAAHDVTSMVASARAAERASIARDIHDELGALLMALKIDLKCSSKTTGAARRAVDSQWPVMLHRVDVVMNTVARIAGQLRPSLVDQIGLWPAIESYVREFEEVTKIPCNLQIDVSHPPLQVEIAHDVFRIFQESLTNVARHADASRVDIKIGVEQGQLELEITDDGTGISADQILDHRSQGVAGMFERTRRFGGELHITRRPERGTKVTLRMLAPAFQ